MLPVSTALSAIGLALNLLGIAVLAYDQWKNQSEDSKLSDIQRFIATLDIGVEEMTLDPIPAGVKTEDGLDLGEAQRLLREATRDAQRTNRKTYLEMMNSVQRSKDSRRPRVRVAL